MNNKKLKADSLLKLILDCDGELDCALKKEVEAFINSYPEYRGKFLKAIKLQETIRENKFERKIDVHQSFDDFISRHAIHSEKSVNYRQILRYAAAIFLPLLIAGSALLVFDISKSGMNTSGISQQVIEAGKSKAVLKLSSGQILELDNTSGILQEDDGTVIEYDSKGVSYTSSDRQIKEKYNQLETPVGGEYFLILSDGTRVWLNAKSTLRYPTKFGEGARKVYLSGEAYFEVAHNPQKSFDIIVEDLSVRALGTSLNVSAYEYETHIQTCLVEGRVEISSKESGKDMVSELYPGYQANYDRTSKTITQDKVNPDDIIAWKNGFFVFDNENIEYIMQRLANWYDIEVEYVNLDTEDYHFTGSVRRYENINKILHMIERTTQLEFEINGRKIFISEPLFSSNAGVSP